MARSCIGCHSSPKKCRTRPSSASPAHFGRLPRQPYIMKPLYHSSSLASKPSTTLCRPILTLPADHPVRSKGPSTLPNQSGLSIPRGITWTEWDQAPPPDAKFHSRIDRTLNGIAQWVTRSSRIPRTNIATAPWDTSAVLTHIPPYDKATATADHKIILQITLADPDNIVAYTDGSQGERLVDKTTATGTGI